MSTQTRTPSFALHVDSIECGHCVSMIATAVRQVDGVTETMVDRRTGTVTVAGARVDREDVRSAIVAAGYTVRP